MKLDYLKSRFKPDGWRLLTITLIACTISGILSGYLGWLTLHVKTNPFFPDRYSFEVPYGIYSWIAPGLIFGLIYSVIAASAHKEWLIRLKWIVVLTPASGVIYIGAAFLGGIIISGASIGGHGYDSIGGGLIVSGLLAGMLGGFLLAVAIALADWFSVPPGYSYWRNYYLWQTAVIGSVAGIAFWGWLWWIAGSDTIIGITRLPIWAWCVAFAIWQVAGGLTLTVAMLVEPEAYPVASEPTTDARLASAKWASVADSQGLTLAEKSVDASQHSAAVTRNYRVSTIVLIIGVVLAIGIASVPAYLVVKVPPTQTDVPEDYSGAFSLAGLATALAPLPTKVPPASAELEGTLSGHMGAVYSVAWSPDGKQLTSASADNSIIVWDVSSGKPLTTLSGHTASVNDVAWSPDGKHLASASADETVIIWDAATGKALTTLAGHTASVNSVAWSPDGKRLASGSWDPTIIIWDMASGKPLQTLSGATASVSSMAWSPDGQRLASGSFDNGITIWDVSSGKPETTYKWHSGFVYDVAWSPDGKYLASASEDTTIIIMDVASRKPLATLSGHAGPVYGVAWSPDSKLLASGSTNNMIIIWDVASRKVQTTLTGHLNAVETVAWSPDGKQLASGSRNYRIIIWDAALSNR